MKLSKCKALLQTELPKILCRRASTGVISKDEQLKSQYDCVIVGGGHNGLVAAAYLSKAGKQVAVLERRHVLGGAAVTEEIIPGFKFSRASYLLSLLRPQIMEELELKKHGLKLYFRDPCSYTPMNEDPVLGEHPRSLLLSHDEEFNRKQISKFSKKDANALPLYEAQMHRFVQAIQPLLDNEPPNISKLNHGSLIDRIKEAYRLRHLVETGRVLQTEIPNFYELLTAPASKVLNSWFESEPLKATLGTDSVIGAMVSPHTPGSSYVLLHHVMGELEGRKGCWAYAEGGMGAVSMAIAKSAASHGADIFVNKEVKELLIDAHKKAYGVVLQDGTEIRADIVFSNATAKVTYLDLCQRSALDSNFVYAVESIDYTSPVTKINVAIRGMPNFLANPSKDGEIKPHHKTTIHLNCEHMDLIHNAYTDAVNGYASRRPVIEMVMPSSLDPTLAPTGSHVVLFFTQYTPYVLADGGKWDEHAKETYANLIFDTVEKYAPGFRELIIGYEVLPPPELERIFGLTGGNIFHGAMSLDQLYIARPLPQYSGARTPIQGLYLCGSGGHPGGGVMGSPGRIAAQTALASS